MFRPSSPPLPSHPAPLDSLPPLAPPPDSAYDSRESLLAETKKFASNHGYALVIERSRGENKLWLRCDRGGIYRERQHVNDGVKKRNRTSRLMACPFRLRAVRKQGVWNLTTVNAEHNHEPSESMTAHPSLRRLSVGMRDRIRVLTEEGVRPARILEILEDERPDIKLLSRDIYNARKQIKDAKAAETMGLPPEPVAPAAIPAEGGQWLWLSDDPFNPAPPPQLNTGRKRRRPSSPRTVPPAQMLDPRLQQNRFRVAPVQQSTTRARPGRLPTTRNTVAAEANNSAPANNAPDRTTSRSAGDDDSAPVSCLDDSVNTLFTDLPVGNPSSTQVPTRSQLAPSQLTSNPAPVSAAAAQAPASNHPATPQPRAAPAANAPTDPTTTTRRNQTQGADRIMELRMARVEKEQIEQGRMLVQILSAVQELQRR